MQETEADKIHYLLTQALRYAYAGQTIVMAPGTYSSKED